MKNPKDNQTKTHRAIGLVFAAAVLAICVAAGVFLMHLRNARKPETYEPGVTKLHLTAQTDSIEAVMQSEHGYYFLGGSVEYAARKDRETGMEQLEQLFGRNGAPVLMYADKETGAVVPVCARPNCLHDGDLFCPASTRAYSEVRPIYYDGWIYSVSIKYDEPDAIDPQYGMRTNYNGHQVLLRYAPDGTEITELYDFGACSGDYRPVTAVHRGYLWLSCVLVHEGETVVNPLTGEEELFQNGGYEIWGYEFKTGKLTKMYEDLAEPSANVVKQPPNALCGIGDDLYFQIQKEVWSGTNSVYRLNLLSGEVSDAGKGNLEYGFSDTHILRRQLAGVGSAEEGWYLTNLASGTETFLGSWSTGCDNAYLSKDYLYKEQYGTTLQICDFNGNVLGEIPLSQHFSLKEYPKNWKLSYQFDPSGCVTDGMIYASYRVSWFESDTGFNWELESGMLACPVEEILNGKTEWQLVYETIDADEAEENLRIRLEQRGTKA